MSAIGWALLEQLVSVEVWARAAGAASASPLTLALALALVCAVAVAVACASRRVVAARAAAHVRIGPDASADPPRRSSPRPTTRRPSGARGPRAPGAALVG